MATLANYYEVLGVNPDADGAQIKDAYRSLVRKHHPDANPEHQERAEALMKEIMEAYATLGDPEKRARYDTENRLRDFENRFQKPEPPISNAPTRGEMPRSLVGRVRTVLEIEPHDFAGRLGLSDAALAQLEARDAVPQTPIQLRTFTNFCDQAVKRAEASGQHSLANEIRGALSRKKNQRAAWG